MIYIMKGVPLDLIQIKISNNENMYFALRYTRKNVKRQRVRALGNGWSYISRRSIDFTLYNIEETQPKH